MNWRTCAITRCRTFCSMFNRREVLLTALAAALSFENARRVRGKIFSAIQNNRKRYDGYLAALLDPEIWSFDRRRASRNCAMR